MKKAKQSQKKSPICYSRLFLTISGILIISLLKTGCSFPEDPYFDKTVFDYKRNPQYHEIKSMLPVPILDEKPEWLEMYWKCWELAFSHIKAPTSENGFVSNYLDEAFNPNIFQWDTIFMVLFARYGHDAFPAIQSLDNFYVKQHKNGFISREIWETTGWDYHSELSPDAVNPPLFSWAEIESYRITGDKSRLESVLPVLEKYAEWLESARKFKTTHNLYWNSNLGSGMDNSPRRGAGWVDMSAQMAMQYSNISFICRELNDEGKAVHYQNKADQIAARINQWMWNDADGLYYDIDHSGNQIKTRTVASFWPMLAGITSENQEKRLLENLNDPNRFKRKNIFPALAADQWEYDSTGSYWKGGVWAPTNYMIIRGLSLQGYQQAAYDFTTSYLNSMSRIFEKTGTVWELYAPDQDIPGSGVFGQHGSHQARPDFVGWSGCGPIAMLIENIIGIRLDTADNTITWHMLHDGRSGIQNLKLGNNTVSLLSYPDNGSRMNRTIEVNSKNDFTLIIVENGNPVKFQINKRSQTISIKT